MPFDQRLKDLNVDTIHVELNEWSGKFEIQLDGTTHDNKTTWMLIYVDPDKVKVNFRVARKDDEP